MILIMKVVPLVVVVLVVAMKHVPREDRIGSDAMVLQMLMLLK